MRILVLVLLLSVTGIITFLLFSHKSESERQPALGSSRTNKLAFVSRDNATIVSINELRTLLIDNYHSTNEHDSMTSLLSHQLIAERLRTNQAFLEWGTNVTAAIVIRFITNGSVPVYGSAGLTAENLQFYKVTAQAPVGLDAEVVYDPHPDSEGPLIFIIQGGGNPTIQMVQNQYRLEAYQLDPEMWKRYQRHIGRMDWSHAVQPLDKEQVRSLAYRAFNEMTGVDLRAFSLEKSEVNVEEFRDPDAAHPEVNVTGNINARLYTPKDKLYPFADFRFDDNGAGHRPNISFSGEMVQTSPGHGEFVELFAVVSKTEAIFELGEKFLGQGTWEQAMLDNVRSLNTQQRGEVYRRIFQH
jgi:hypothetical protein